ncbi:MAG: protein kinase [Fibrobacteria bacterium]|nr:protein kinase [Fibrobacteria bacterium]
MNLFEKKKKTEKSFVNERYDTTNRYLFQKDLGAGGMAKVKSIFDTSLNRQIAGKELRKKNVNNELLVKTFINEAKLISYLDHPGVASIFDTFLNEEGIPCYTMKLVEGQTLDDLLKDPQTGKRRALPVATSLDIFVKICETLAYAHHKGVIHLDLKPANIMIGNYGEVVVMDWGSARLYDVKPYQEYIGKKAGNQDVPVLESENKNFILGTFQYMSPEHFIKKREELTPASDIFSAGIILYRMLTGLHPFPAKNFEDAKNIILKKHPPMVHKLRSDVQRMLSMICAKMMKKNIPNRFRDGGEVLAIMKKFMDSGQTFFSRSYKAGEVIFREGDVGDFAFIIESGRVEILKLHEGKHKALAILEKNQIVGELAIFSQCSRTASARALEETTIRILGRAEVEKELDKISPWVGRMISTLSSRFIGLNQQLLDNGV